MSRTAITTARTAITQARTAITTARTAVNSWRVPIEIYDMGIRHLWDFRTGFNGTNQAFVCDALSGGLDMNWRGSTALSSVYTANSYQADLERLNNDYFMSNPYRFVSGMTAITYFAWFKRESTGVSIHHILSDWDTAGNQRGSRLYLTSDVFEMTFSSNGTNNASYTSTETLTDTASYHFVVGTYDTTNRGQIKLDDTYLTVALSAGSHPVGINSSNISKLIGCNLPSTPANFFDGMIGICGIAPNVALTSAQASRLYNLTRRLMGV